MSYCEIKSFKDGKPYQNVKFKNSYGGADFIWTALFNKYLKDPSIRWDSWLLRCADSGDKSLWNLAKRKDLPLFERAVHASTFTYATINKKHFKQFAEHLRQFVDIYTQKDYVCHLLEWAKFADKCDGDLICFYMTSLSEDPWGIYDEYEDDYINYDFEREDKHFEVYEWLDEIDDGK